METKLSFDEINPYIRFAQILDLKKDTYLRHSKAFDYRLFYVYKGEGIIQVNDINYNMSKGNLLIWQPGIKYHLNFSAKELTLIGMNFDYTHNQAQKNYPIPPSNDTGFDSNYILETVRFADMDCLNRPLFLEHMQGLEKELLEIYQEYSNRKKFFNQRITGLFLSVLGMIARTASLNDGQVQQSNHKIDAIIKYIHDHFNEDLSNQDIGLQFNFHPNYINKLMVLHTGSSLHQYLLRHRISRAIHLMQTTNLTVTEIAYQVGFKDANHFSKYFKQKTGRNPSEFWRQLSSH